MRRAMLTSVLVAGLSGSAAALAPCGVKGAHMARRRVGLWCPSVVALLVVAAGAASLQSQAEAQPSPAVAKQFVGAWRLVSLTRRLADGTTSQGRYSVAYIIYADSGHMCMVGMAPGASVVHASELRD
jgi:hypothetical protein